MERSATCLLRAKYSLIRAKKSASVSSVSLATEWTAKVTSNFSLIMNAFFVCFNLYFAVVVLVFRVFNYSASYSVSIFCCHVVCLCFFLDKFNGLILFVLSTDLRLQT